jgi:hypothetical protein
MSQLRLYSLYDSGVGAYLKPFWSDHKANAIRSFIQLVNDKSDPNNMVANHPDQFVLFELGIFFQNSGAFTLHNSPLSLGTAVEFVNVSKDPQRLAEKVLSVAS